MKKILLGLALCSLTITPVLAADTGVYVTGMLGTTVNEKNFNSAMSNGLLLGYRVAGAVYPEVGYTSLATNATLSGLPQGVAATTSISGFEFAGVLDLPITRQLAVFGRVGYANMTVAVNVISTRTTASTSAAESGMLFGAGLKYKIDSSFGVQAGLNSYFLSNNSGADTPVNLYVAGTIFFD